VPAAFTGITNEPGSARWLTAQPASHLPRGRWWRIFEDGELDRLEDLAEGNNQPVMAALARLDEARASVKVARADLLPQVQLDPSYTRQRTSFYAPQNGHAAGIAPTYNTFTALLQAGWEADVWGRVRRQVEAARAQLGASAEDVAAIKLTTQAEVASDYFTLRALDSEADVLVRTIETYRRSLELTVNRRKGGVATDLDVSQAETQLRTPEAQLPAIRLQRAQVVHALASLCGRVPEAFALTAEPLGLGAAPMAPVSLPSELLERRPDIAAAEQRMIAANANVGVAEGAFYPHIVFNGLAGLQSVDATTWLHWPSRLWSVGPSLELPLFTGGRNRAQLSLARAQYEENVANYRQVVLGAFQEVEDQLAAQTLLASQLEAEAAALKAAQRTLEIANNRYKSGLVTYLEVATAQSAALTLESTVVQLRGQELVAVVGLVKALGGGYGPATERE